MPAYAAAAAALKRELTLPGIGQTVILTRMGGASTPMPDGEDLATLAQSRATLALHLSVRRANEIVATLSPLYGADCPAILAYRVGWPDQAFSDGTLSDLKARIRTLKITRTALIFVGRVFARDSGRDAVESALYSADHAHVLRPTRGG